MNSLRSAVALRTILCDTSSELRSINSTILPNGATAFDNETDTLWRLDKTAGAVFDALLGSGLLLKPDDQTDARWFAEETSGSSPYYHSSYLASPVAVTMTSNQWNQLGSTTGTFAESAGAAALFTLSTTTGLITYTGPTRQVLVTMQAVINNGIGATPIDVYAAISRNGDVVDGSTTSYPEKGQMDEVITNVASLITVQRIMQLSDGITLQMMFKNITNQDDIVVNGYQCTVAPL